MCDEIDLVLELEYEAVGLGAATATTSAATDAAQTGAELRVKRVDVVVLLVALSGGAHDLRLRRAHQVPHNAQPGE